jgi:hypothetical protein
MTDGQWAGLSKIAHMCVRAGSVLIRAGPEAQRAGDREPPDPFRPFTLENRQVARLKRALQIPRTKTAAQDLFPTIQ